jgi:predicted O-methyltransferase YrrM
LSNPADNHGWSWADMHAWEVLRPLLDAGPYLPWSEGALRPSALVKVANEITLGRRRRIVELGSGVSTIVIARLLRERGGQLHSVEHEPAWARFVSAQLELEGLGPQTKVIESPLGPHSAALEGSPWYDASLPEKLPGKIDLLLIDGPPGYGEGMERSRYPALPALRDRLVPGALVVLDDAERPGEEEIVKRWSEETGLRFGLMKAEGIAVATVPAE